MPISARPRFVIRTLGAMLAAWTLASSAQAQGVSIIRDAEVEQLLRDYANPVFKAARINAGFIKITLIGDKQFNAFVADGHKMFINTGAIIDSTRPTSSLASSPMRAGISQAGIC